MAVLLEIARVLVSDPSISLPGPVLFLFNGGEETLMQAAHGFVSSGHRWVGDIRAFINLEATGSGGPDTLFQHTGGWTAETYAAAAKYPRGSVFLQVCKLARFCRSDSSQGLDSFALSVVLFVFWKLFSEAFLGFSKSARLVLKPRFMYHSVASMSTSS